jgi:CheY-like chemotaxis protein
MAATSRANGTHAAHYVIVIDKNETNRRIIKYWLERFRMRCIAEANALRAVEQLQWENTFDAVIDFELPDTEALSLAGAIRQLPDDPALQSLLVTSGRPRVGDPGAVQTISASIYEPTRPRRLFEALSRTSIKDLLSFERHRR